jgi:uncharacterized protein YqhQ
LLRPTKSKGFFWRIAQEINSKGRGKYPGLFLQNLDDMQNNVTQLESLLAHAEQYNKTSLELLKLKSVDKTADVASSILSSLLMGTVLTVFALILTLAISFWLGDLLGKTYYGFFLVALVYGIIGLVVFLRYPFIKVRLNNFIILKMLS